MILYLCHPVAPTPEQVERRLADKAWRRGVESWARDIRQAARSSIISTNVDRALSWLGFLVRHTPWTITAPWIPYVLELDDDNPADRARGTHDSQAMARAAGGIILTGGRISTGMHADKLAHVEGPNRGPVVDLTDLGARPPVDPGSGVIDPRWRDELARRLAAGMPS